MFCYIYNQYKYYGPSFIFLLKLFNTQIYSFILTNTVFLLCLSSTSCFLAASIVLYSSAFLFNNYCFLSESIVLYCCAIFFSRSCFSTISIVLYFGTVFSAFPVNCSHPLLVFSPIFFVWRFYCFMVLFLSMIIHHFFFFRFRQPLYMNIQQIILWYALENHISLVFF